MLGNMDCAVWLKGQLFPLSVLEECEVCPHAGLVSPRKEPGEAEGMAAMWQTVLTNGREEGSLHVFPFPALLFLIFGEGLQKVNRILVWRSS